MKRIGASIVATALVAGLSWWGVQGRGTPAGDGQGAVVVSSPPSLVAPAVRPSLARALPAPRAEEAAGDGEGALAIATTDVLAEVNGVALRLADLMAIEPGEDERLLEPAALRYLLERAITRELVAQAARARGVTLDRAQVAALAARRAQLTAGDDGTLTELTRTAAAVDFELRDAEGLMLQANLLAAGGAPSPHVTAADVDAYYRAHQDELGSLPPEPVARAAAWRTIDGMIRQRLASSRSADYARALEERLRELRAQAHVILRA